jgi:hypothetical protein
VAKRIGAGTKSESYDDQNDEYDDQMIQQQQPIRNQPQIHQIKNNNQPQKQPPPPSKNINNNFQQRGSQNGSLDSQPIPKLKNNNPNAIYALGN